MRVIAGKLKGRRLHSIRGMTTRPTADRVKESVFSILGDRTEGSTALDLFAGTGALGIEAVSRGALTAVLVDNNREARAVMDKNITTLEIRDRCRIRGWDLRRPFTPLRREGLFFDLVFMDPPYGGNLLVPVLQNLSDADVLAEGAIIVAEHGSPDDLTNPPLGFETTDRRNYGRTFVSFLFYERMSDHAENCGVSRIF